MSHRREPAGLVSWRYTRTGWPDRGLWSPVNNVTWLRVAMVTGTTVLFHTLVRRRGWRSRCLTTAWPLVVRLWRDFTDNCWKTDCVKLVTGVPANELWLWARNAICSSVSLSVSVCLSVCLCKTWKNDGCNLVGTCAMLDLEVVIGHLSLTFDPRARFG